MPRLILLNGPPGIGKSTLAATYVQRHPGVLNLDIDRLRTFVGGWRDRFAETGEIVRPLALAMARTHLASGADVVLPQYLGRPSEIERFEQAAHHAGGEFRELVLLDDRRHAVDRFYRRGTDDPDPWHDEVRRIVEADGGRAALEAMYDRLTDAVATRPQTVVIDSAVGDLERSYHAFLAALGTHPAG